MRLIIAYCISDDNIMNLDAVYFVILSSWIVASLARLLALRWSRQNLLKDIIDKKSNKKKFNSASNIEYDQIKPSFFVIFIPLLREQTMILEIIDHFKNFAHVEGRIIIALVTTKRENIQGLSEPQKTTYDVVTQALSKLSNISPNHIFKHYHTDGNDTCKGDQINQAIKNFLSEFDWLDEKEIYVGVYDADSRPDTSIITFLYNQINLYFQIHKNFPPAFQQIPIYFNNMKQSWNLNSIFINSRTLHNLDFALTREFPAMQASIDCYDFHGIKYYATAWLTHLIGHGEFIHFPVLKKVGFFRAPSADTSLGYVLAYLGIPIMPVPLFDVGETPNNLSILVKQGATWYRGVSLYWRDFIFSTKIGYVNRIRATIMIVKVIYNNLAWAIFPLVILLAFIMALVSGNQFLCYLAITGILTYLLPNMIQMTDYPAIQSHCSKFSNVPHLSLFYRIVLVLVYPFTKLFAMLGPWLHYLRKLKSLLGFNIEYQKTERAKK